MSEITVTGVTMPVATYDALHARIAELEGALRDCVVAGAIGMEEAVSRARALLSASEKEGTP